MANLKGNPDFGIKYRLKSIGDVPLSEQVKAQIDPETKEHLKTLAQKKQCTVPDLLREAIEQYLSAADNKSASV